MPQMSKLFFCFFFNFKQSFNSKIKLKIQEGNQSQSQTFQVHKSSSTLKSTWISINQLSNQIVKVKSCQL